ncbi:MAG: hypothetical protein Q8P68_02395 [Candidatus Peregrinibacteria bacterium]|nr:hypothetical protein [Candidatus Peregrinibacteria bacterium]
MLGIMAGYTAMLEAKAKGVEREQATKTGVTAAYEEVVFQKDMRKTLEHILAIDEDGDFIEEEGL